MLSVCFNSISLMNQSIQLPALLLGKETSGRLTSFNIHIVFVNIRFSMAQFRRSQMSNSIQPSGNVSFTGSSARVNNNELSTEDLIKASRQLPRLLEKLTQENKELEQKLQRYMSIVFKSSHVGCLTQCWLFLIGNLLDTVRKIVQIWIGPSRII